MKMYRKLFKKNAFKENDGTSLRAFFAFKEIVYEITKPSFIYSHTEETAIGIEHFPFH